MTRSLPSGEYTLTTQAGPRTITGTADIDEYGYWFLNDEGHTILHVAHGSLHSIEPAPTAVTPKAENARDKLRARAGR
ncbi:MULTISPECIES: hypothetical protein [unclassified Microbacterium]|uniref:hypothetical protein n=1 Tax=unclassified Microbacterium TaxID=2609290 RepID=UPI0038661D4B